MTNKKMYVKCLHKIWEQKFPESHYKHHHFYIVCVHAVYMHNDEHNYLEIVVFNKVRIENLKVRIWKSDIYI